MSAHGVGWRRSCLERPSWDCRGYACWRFFGSRHVVAFLTAEFHPDQVDRLSEVPVLVGVVLLLDLRHRSPFRLLPHRLELEMAVGGGFELALSCNLILASSAATSAFPKIRAGTLADAATIKLPKRRPFHIAMELLFTGRWMDAAEGRCWGVVNEVPEPRRAACGR